ncbi:RpiB/LacA/LacB family sugar-phosphate isomerase [Phytohabitans houttuyneae]|uniref:RpiB/LacA/LacB family sugar-phosphate isomerase n=1 Tax=Phytohabitans houttuyneae TaxID=1076126 RepID=UPI0015674783|nr:RpiB/LacA/LacB family sugar-phosphate isomerase [Phytohabitans houttuyneae]
MRIAYGADDDNETTRAVLDYLSGLGEVVRVGADRPWPQIGAAVGQAVTGGDADLGVVMCWTGTGTAIAANKVPGVRAALAWEPWIAAGARKWNDANVLAMSLKRLAPDVAVEVARAFFETAEPDPDEAANIALLAALDHDQPPAAVDQGVCARVGRRVRPQGP